MRLEAQGADNDFKLLIFDGGLQAFFVTFGHLQTAAADCGIRKRRTDGAFLLAGRIAGVNLIS